MTDEIQQGLVDMHNKYRNQQANGDTPHYESATRMATIVRSPHFTTKNPLKFKS